MNTKKTKTTATKRKRKAPAKKTAARLPNLKTLANDAEKALEQHDSEVEILKKTNLAKSIAEFKKDEKVISRMDAIIETLNENKKSETEKQVKKINSLMEKGDFSAAQAEVEHLETHNLPRYLAFLAEIKEKTWKKFDKAVNANETQEVLAALKEAESYIEIGISEMKNTALEMAAEIKKIFGKFTSYKNNNTVPKN